MFENGTVTTQNIKEVVNQLRALLTDKKYTTVHCYEYKNYVPKVRLHQELGGSKSGGGINLHFHSDKHAQVLIHDSYGADGFSTTQIEAKYDSEFKAPYVVFKHGQFRITHRAPSGKLIHCVYAPE